MLAVCPFSKAEEDTLLRVSVDDDALEAYMLFLPFINLCIFSDSLLPVSVTYGLHYPTLSMKV